MNPLSRSRNGRAWSTCAFVLTALFAVVGLTSHGVQTVYAASSITLAGSLQNELGCTGDWDPACAATHLTSVGNDVWRGEFTLPAGDYAYKMVIDNDWGNGSHPGADKSLSLTTETIVRFYFDEKTNGVVDSVNDTVAVAAGTFQSELGCADDWQPWCVQSLLTDADVDGVYSFATTGLPVGSYDFKVALNEAWDVSYPVGNVPFTTTAEGDVVTMTWDSATSDVAVEVTAPAGPDYSVALVGSLQDELGCSADWQPECAATEMAYDAEDDMWQATFNLTGDFEYKVALNDTWDESYGDGSGNNIPLAAAGDVKFYYDRKTNYVADNVNSTIVTAAGSFQSELGCSGDWQPWCLRSMLQDADGDGTYTFVTDTIPAGDYEAKAALNEGWDVSYGVDGGDANIPFTVVDGDIVTFSFDSATNIMTISAETPPIDWVVAGNFQDDLPASAACGEWNNACPETTMEDSNGDGVFRLEGNGLAAGSYEYKIVESGNWDNAHPSGNVGFTADGSQMRWYFQPDGFMIADNANQCIATVAGSFQDELGGPEWAPWNLRTMLWQEAAGSDWYSFTATIPAGEWEYKVARDEDWAEAYPAGNIPLSLAAAADVTFRYNCADNTVEHIVDTGDGSTTIEPGDELLVQAPVAYGAQEEIFYFVLPDRFQDGDASNNEGGAPGGTLAETGYKVDDKAFYHGGDFAGLESKLDYLSGLGVTALWITPPFENLATQPDGGTAFGFGAAYHGYWILDFENADPHLGTNDELKALIASAHAQDIKVYFDIVVNHTADVIQYDGGSGAYISKADQPYLDASGIAFDDDDFAGTDSFPVLDAAVSFPYLPLIPAGQETAKNPAWLNDPIYYHNRGNSTFSGENSEYGDFFGLDDLFTENPVVVDGFIDIFKNIIDEYNVDGFRLDTVKHVNIELWQKLAPEVIAYAESQGKTDFYMYGEVFDGNPAFLSTFTTEGQLQSVLDFGLQGTVTGIAAYSSNTDQLSNFFAQDDYYTDADSNAYGLANFISNHDIGRIGKAIQDGNGGASDAEMVARSELAHGLLFFARGFPIVYYGDEQGFTGDGGDKDARENMMPSQVAVYNDNNLIGTSNTTAGDNFDMTHPLYQTFSEFAAVRAAHPALSYGAQIQRYSESSAGMFAFSRIDRTEQVEYLIVLNNSESSDTAAFGTFSPDTSFTQLWPGTGTAVVSDSSGNVSITLDGLSFAIYMANQAIPASSGPIPVSVSAPEADSSVSGRVEVAATLDSDQLAEVTFAVSIDGGDYTSIGVDTNAPYRVYFDVSDLADGTAVTFKAIANDLNGNLSSDKATATVGAPTPPPAGDVPYAIIHYYREDGDYGDHTTGQFNDFLGLAPLGDAIAPEEVTDWPAPKPFLGEDEYGRFAWIALQDASQNVNFIVHRGDTKDGTDADRSFNPSTDGAEIWLKQGDGNFYTSQAAAQGYVTIRYNRSDGDYGDPSSANFEDFWGLHLWGDAIDPAEVTDWPAPKKPTGFDDYGAYWEVAIQNAAEPVNFIIHRGDAKDPGPDQSFTPTDSATVWIQSGDETIYTSRGAAEDYATIHYHRADGDYGDYTSSDFSNFWGLHIWEGAASPNPSWQEPVKPAGFDIYGPYFEIPVIDGAPQLAYIIHRGDAKDPGPDQFLIFNTWGYEVWQLEGEGPVVDQPHYVLPTLGEPGPNPGNLTQQRAYWVDETTIAWDAPVSLSNSYQLHYAAAGGIETTEAGLANSDGSLTLTPSVLSDAVKAKFPHLADLPAFAIDAADADMVPAVLKGQIAVSAVDGEGVSIDATGLQIPGVLDDLYTYNGELGVSWDGNGVPTLRVWAPTAQNVTFHLFADSDPATTSTTTPMEYDPVSGVWSIIGDASWKDQYYLYEVAVYVNSTGQVENNIVTDPYSFSLSMNSTRSQIVDLRDAALKPAGWDNIAKPELVAPEDISIYELHVRDFSIYDETVAEADRGTFKAFTYSDSAGMLHLKALAEAGLSHLHLLPVFDIATIDEDKSAQTNPDPDVLDDYAPDSDQQQAAIAAVGDQDGFNWGYDPYHYTVPEGSYSTNPDGITRIVEFREMVQTVNDSGMRLVMDVVYNHTNASGQAEKSVLDKIVPGYYHRLNDVGVVEKSTCCDNTASEHAMFEKLMIDSLVTWAIEYKVDAFRFDLMGHHMVSNMLNVRAALDELTIEEHGVDGKSIYLYGEGWNFGEVANNARGVNATQLNLAGTGIGTFSDRMRDAIRGGGCCPDAVGLFAQGFGNGLYTDPNSYDTRSAEDQKNELLLMSDQVRVEMAGGLASYELIDRNGNLVTGAQVPYGGSPAGYVNDPQEIISYVSKHDNQTLYDINAYGLPADTPMSERIRAQAVGLSTVMYGQGIPFFHAGVDLLRSKSLDRDSYNSGDWFNRLDFTYQSNNFGVGLPIAEKNQSNWQYMSGLLADSALRAGYEDITKMNAMFREMLAVRNSSKLFRLETAADIQERVVFHNTGPNQIPGLIVMTIDDTVGADLDALHQQVVVLINAGDEPQTFTASALAGTDLYLHPVLLDSVDEAVKATSYDAVTGEFTISGRTSAVFVAYTPADQLLDQLMDDVDVLVANDVLSNKRARILKRQLKIAEWYIDRDRDHWAIKRVIVFKRLVKIYTRIRVLPASEGDVLIDKANLVIMQLRK